jgi:hypothetical protein
MANRPASPATGLLIYQIDNGAGFYYFDGSDWKAVMNNTTTLAGGTQVVGANGLKVNTTNAGTGSADWVALNAGGSAGDRVVAGNLNGNATIGGHNNALNAWSDLTINQGGGNVIVGGQDQTPPSGGVNSSFGRPLVVNGSVRQTYYSAVIDVPNVLNAPNNITSITWNHNLGYNPVVMMSTSETSGLGNMDQCTYTTYSPDFNHTVFLIRNLGNISAHGLFNWILVY